MIGVMFLSLPVSFPVISSSAPLSSFPKMSVLLIWISRLYIFSNAAGTVLFHSAVAVTVAPSFGAALPLTVSAYPFTSYPLSVKVTSVPTGTFSITHVYGFSVLPSPLAAFPSVNIVSLKLFVIWKPFGRFSKPLNAFVTCTLPLAGFSVFAT